MKTIPFALLTFFFVFQATAGEPVALKLKIESQKTAAEQPPTAVPSDTVVLKTSLGNVTVKLAPQAAPATVANFLRYVKEGFYSKTLCHRVIPNFMIQCGGLSKGLQEKATHESVKNESNNGLKNVRGSITMARTSAPDSATAQFFINVADNPSLDGTNEKPGYTVFGTVTAGMDVVDKIAAVPTHSAGIHQDVPVEDVMIMSVENLPAPAPKKR